MVQEIIDRRKQVEQDERQSGSGVPNLVSETVLGKDSSAQNNGGERFGCCGTTLVPVKAHKKKFQGVRNFQNIRIHQQPGQETVGNTGIKLSFSVEARTMFRNGWQIFCQTDRHKKQLACRIRSWCEKANGMGCHHGTA